MLLCCLGSIYGYGYSTALYAICLCILYWKLPVDKIWKFRISPRNMQERKFMFPILNQKNFIGAILTQASSNKIEINPNSIAVQLEELNLKYFTRDLNPSEVLKKLAIRTQ